MKGNRETTQTKCQDVISNSIEQANIKKKMKQNQPCGGATQRNSKNKITKKMHIELPQNK